MNRLIIIGNGFDLAHGIKTSYKDFIADYFCVALNSIYLTKPYDDELIRINVKQGQYYQPGPLDAEITPENSIALVNQILKSSRIFSIQFKSTLLKNSFDKIDKFNWVDLEIEYFNVLLATKYAFKNNNEFTEIQKVNHQLDYLKERLIEYLTRQQSNFTNSFDTKPLVDCFTEVIHPHELVTVNIEEKITPKNLYFINFNYTNTFENYMNKCVKIIPSKSNYIHGNLSGGHGKPIFGFGDELDKRYLEFEDEKNNELFRHIKSFEYLKTKNYSLLTSFLESDDFQVHIYGHSCGLSDRTMLNQIFEHENCKSIKIFYHKIDEHTNDYTEKTYEMSRHFRDKGMMRKKVISFDRSSEMPQPVKEN